MSKKHKNNQSRSDDTEQEILTEDGITDGDFAESSEEETVTAEEPAAEETAAEEPAVAEETAEAVQEEPAPAPAPAVEVAEGETRTATVMRPVYFRTGASFKNAVIAELKQGVVVPVTGTVEGDKGTWYKCEFDGRTGFVKASGLSVN